MRHPVEHHPNMHPVQRHPNIHRQSERARHPEESHKAPHRTPGHSTSRRTPREVGHAAGLRIRREMERRELERRAAYRRRLSHRTRFRRAQLVEARYTPERPEPVPAQAYAPQPRSEMQRYAAASAIDNRPLATGQPSAAPAFNRAATDPEIQSGTESETEPGIQSGNESGGYAETEPGTGLTSTDLRNTGLPSAEPSSGPEPSSDMASLVIPRGAMPAPLRGSLASLERQNERLTSEGLERILNENDLAARIANHLLVPVPVSDAMTVNPDLPINHRYCRPWTAQFLADLARDHEAVFHRPLEVSSAVRTVQYQRKLMRINGNAAPAQGDIVSPHLTGATVDIAKNGLTRDEMKWMRHRLLQLQDEGKIDVEEEFQQSCFHITVYTSYAPPRPLRHALHPHYTPPAPQDQADGSDTEGL
ncbi:MAG TPA: DUF5715 family protein [Terracidiphilus sp.]|jgi:hypothetical protein|nr:DUF5715 family protein [Terracidiphilus sp.]